MRSARDLLLTILQLDQRDAEVEIIFDQVVLLLVWPPVCIDPPAVAVDRPECLRPGSWRTSRHRDEGEKSFPERSPLPRHHEATAGGRSAWKSQ